ncbi:hypothetical protein OG799_15200 [Micromonospora sp. NBC_00898]|uniref:hypothetical protein n=1 Tax=Micromonospora sp. NBC_00898 TaxID=2975981 RepID=UPI00386A2354|nr:hypothetical protein OG799_15200 [Micromonospora sp. NBC_00898]
MIAALDLPPGGSTTESSTANAGTNSSASSKTLRRRWPNQRLHVILGNLLPAQAPRGPRTWCTANQVDLVFRTTYASWLNWIEVEFAAVRYFALNGTDHRTHAERGTAIGAYIRWRNYRAQPKSGFAINSKIRHPDYPFKAA